MPRRPAVEVTIRKRKGVLLVVTCDQAKAAEIEREHPRKKTGVQFLFDFVPADKRPASRIEGPEPDLKSEK
jgi:hypothetical protein